MYWRIVILLFLSLGVLAQLGCSVSAAKANDTHSASMGCEKVCEEKTDKGSEAKLVFEEDFESGSMKKWKFVFGCEDHSINLVTSQEKREGEKAPSARTGNTAMRFEIKPGDRAPGKCSSESRDIMADWKRAMLRSPSVLENEKDNWVTWSTYFPANFGPKNLRDKSIIIMQVHGGRNCHPNSKMKKGKNPLVILALRDEDAKGEYIWGVSSRVKGYDMDSIVVGDRRFREAGKWVDFKLHYRPSENNGVVRLWRKVEGSDEDILMAEYTGSTRCKMQSPYITPGLYHHSKTDNIVTYFDNIKVHVGAEDPSCRQVCEQLSPGRGSESTASKPGAEPGA